MRQSLLPLLVLVLTASCQVEEEPPRTLVDKDSAAPKEDSSAGREQKTGDEEDYGLHVTNPGRPELREYFERIGGIWAKDCEEWSTDDSRVGMLAPLGTSRLFIGRPKADGDGIDAIEKNYEVSSVVIGGSPFEGAVRVMLQAADMRVEKVCLEKLRGTAIRWERSGGDSGYPDVDGEVVVRDVKFSRAARISGGEVAATGAFVATLKVSEDAMSMVLREISAHFWGIVGSALLMVFVAVVGWLTRRLRKAMGGTWIKLNLPSRKRFWRNLFCLRNMGE